MRFLQPSDTIETDRIFRLNAVFFAGQILPDDGVVPYVKFGTVTRTL